MTKAEELLNSLDETDESLYPEVVEEEPAEPVRLAALYAATATETDEPHVVIFDDRSMYVPDSIKKIGVQFDHDVNLIRFDCPRYSDGVDLYPMQFYVNYIRPDGTPGAYHVEDVTIDETDSTILHFSWHVLRHATEYQGNLTILVCVKETDDAGNLEHHWNTELNTDFYLSEGLECADTILAEYPDIITQLLTEMDVVKAIATPEAMQGYANTWLNQYGAETVRSVEQKGQEVLDSIPEDYTQLSNDVNELKSDIEQLKQSGGGGSGTGLSTEEKTLMLSLFKATVYDNSEMQATVDALEQKWTGSGSGEEAVYYTITNNLTNVTSSNSVGAVAENTSYSATLTADSGYNLESVIVTMGGTDITATAYADGVISIDAVTGNIVITASATATVEARTVYYASDDSITKTNAYMNKEGTFGLIDNIRYKCATLPYSEGMEIHTYCNSSSIGSFPPVVLYDGTNYTVPEYEEIGSHTYKVTLSGLSNPTVYVNMFGTPKGEFADEKFYYVTQ